jgi:hypothetical protein
MGLRADVRAAEAVIAEVMGVDPRPWFRLPFGAGAHNQLVLDRLAALGYRHVGWTIVPKDWEPELTAAMIETRVVDPALSADRPSIVLLHAWPTATSGAIAGIVGRLRDAGVELVRVDELPDRAIVSSIGDAAAKPPAAKPNAPTPATTPATAPT